MGAFFNFLRPPNTSFTLACKPFKSVKGQIYILGVFFMKIIKGLGIFILCAIILVALLCGAVGISSLITKAGFVETLTLWCKSVLSVLK